MVWHETIRCPECGHDQEAAVTWDRRDPWPIRVKNCETCKYIIIESEWEVIREGG